MYTLYFMPGACSLAVQVVLRELEQEFTLINKLHTDNFTAINPLGNVPALVMQDKVLTEGAAIMLHLIQSHPSDFWSSDPNKQQQIIEDLMLANATMHPAYGRLFFATHNIESVGERERSLIKAAEQINLIWQTVGMRLESRAHLGPFLGGQQPSVADIFLTVYASWGEHFFVDIHIPDNVQQVLDKVRERDSFKAAVSAEQSN
ncbi:glutathione S-transferase family protein [Pseudoalteromonas luteoviolacea]|uniref:Glutathione S-transferase n=1 Tax=Pseudoalteromonas luteoviolacea (strain 2ta16) TaxID=1353533 RepID=V4HSD8_PSEL2|nr:glutathione S-transferase [Pseudoalteromonas luteoviolacea]ESP90819.1 glutathione S-transferase [Pseudoalteromonas luteoviolacea 2ta16]KZN38423.1 hypothetical protein N483_20920 [Pseudoalteromonas luteoviolacea NCIMB 1944]